MWDLTVSVPDHCLSFYFVLGRFQSRSVLIRWHMVGQGPAVLAADAGRMGWTY